MKNKLKLALVVLAVSFGFSACMDSIVPIDPNVNQTFDQDAVFYKLYTSFVQTGQTGGGGDADIVTDDEGYSGFYRTLCVLNEFPTDAGWWTWRNDAGVSDMLMIAWTSSNPFVSKLYNRLNYGVTMSNHFLDMATGSDEKTQLQRAEVRFIRCMNYYHLMDMFGNVPFTTTVSMGNPEQIARKDLYAWLIEELNEIIPLLKNKNELDIYRASKQSAYMLLARLYLNAEVYTGEADWANAEKYARMLVEDQSLGLHAPFKEIFMADNDATSPEEFIFLAAQDGQFIRSYAGSQYTICSTRTTDMNPCGTTNNSWGCWRSSPELIKVFFYNNETPAEIEAKGHGYDEFSMPGILGDDRAIFSQSNEGSVLPTGRGFWGNVPDNGLEFDSCWAICKWTNVRSDGGDSHDSFYCDTDVPLMRTSEAYLTLAEALFRQGRIADALVYVNAVRSRANCTKVFTEADLTADQLLDEWLREFYHEGRRRIDLVRFGQFVGPTVTRTWEGRSGDNSVRVKSFETKSAWNTEVSAIDAHYALYPIPNTDVVANPNMKQNPGY